MTDKPARKPRRAAVVDNVVHLGAQPAPAPAPMKIKDMAEIETRGRPGDTGDLIAYSKPVAPPPGVLPASMAFDNIMPAATGQVYAWAVNGALREGLGFLGYPYLAELTQRPEYRRISEILAKEMTREWITLTAGGVSASKGKGAGQEAKAKKIAQLENAMRDFDVQRLFRQAAEQDGFFGRSQLYVGTKAAVDDPKETAKPLIIDKTKLGKGELAYFRLIEPLWTYPGFYNADNPLAPDFYRPQMWYVMAQEVHISRLLTFVGREMPDILKPAYQFGGLSLSQMAKPYVDNWLRTRQSVSDLIHSFSVMVLSTDMSTLLAGGSARDLLNRIQIFNNFRDNRGTFVCNKETEELTNVSAQLAGLHELQAQSQEHMSSVTGIPLVVLLGITPSGLNASSESELDTFYAWVKAQQEHLFRPNLKKVIELLQLHVFGEIDPDITFDFNSLEDTDETAEATNRKTDADRDTAYINAGVLDPAEVREALANDEDGPYHMVDLSGPPPEPPADPSLEPDPDGEEDDDKPAPAQDAAFEEGKHPRAKNGEFGSGGGGSGVGPKQGGEAKASRPPFTEKELEGLPQPGAVRQPATDWAQMQAKGAEAREAFAAGLTSVAKSLGLKSDVAAPEHLTTDQLANGDGYLFVAPNKSQARAEEKVENDYGGDWSMLKDMVRGTIAVSTMQEITAAIDAAEAAGFKLAARPKDKFTNPTSEGYRDINALMKMPNGMVAELQFNLKPMLEAKEKVHAAYADQQKLQRKNGSEEPNEKWSDDDRAEFDKLRNQQRAAYGAAWDKVKGEA